jgi:hypothetical protein
MYKNARFTKKGKVQECIVFWSYTTASAGWPFDGGEWQRWDVVDDGGGGKTSVIDH